MVPLAKRTEAEEAVGTRSGAFTHGFSRVLPLAD